MSFKKFCFKILSFLFVYGALVCLVPLFVVFGLYRLILKQYLSDKYEQDIEFPCGLEASFTTFNKIQPSIMDLTLVFRGRLDMDYIRNTVQENWTSVKKGNQYEYKHPRLRSLMTTKLGYHYWLLDKNFNIRNHIQLFNCTPPKNEKQLTNVCATIVSQPLTSDKPLWKMVAFPLDDSYHKEPRYVIVCRLHHSLADGYNYFRLIGQCFLNAPHLAGKKRESIFDLSALKTFANSLFTFPYYVIKYAIPRDVNILHGATPSGDYDVAFAPAVSMDRLKRIQKKTGTTINDIATSCVAGAFIRFFQTEKTKPYRIRCFVPLALNYEDEEVKFSNKVSGLAVTLPVSCDGPIDLLLKTRKKLSRVKDTKFGELAYFIADLVWNRLPDFLTSYGYLLTDFTYFVTNVPWYRSGCYGLNGDALVEVLPFPVLISKTGIGIVIISCNGNIRLGIKTDKGVIDNPHIANDLILYWTEEFVKLESAVNS